MKIAKGWNGMAFLLVPERQDGGQCGKSILKNEKYMGEALLQKTYTVDFLTKKRVKNNGIVQQYYVEDSHPPIINKEEFDRYRRI